MAEDNMHIQLPDLTIEYEDTGGHREKPSPTVLLIHGYPLSRQMWKPQVRELGQNARFIAPDLRGFGDSQATPGIYTMESLAEDCIAFLDCLGISDQVIVCGLSMGGYIAFALYRKYPHRVQGLILSDTRAAADSPEAKINRDKAILLAEKEGAEAIARSMLPKMLASNTYSARPDLVEQVRGIMLSASVPGIIGVLAGMRDRTDSTPLLSQIDVPTMLIFGEEDQFTPQSEVEMMRGSIHDVRLHWIPGAGHLPNLEQPEIYNNLIKDYLSEFNKNQ
jgi:pimeloyl-ACP methyl ester carboxylesterase